MDIEVKQRPRLSPRFVNDEIIESVVLQMRYHKPCLAYGLYATYVWYNEILLEYYQRLNVANGFSEQAYLDIHEIISANAPKFWKLSSALFKECADLITLLALE